MKKISLGQNKTLLQTKEREKPLLSVKTNIHFAPLQISPFQIMADTWFYKTTISATEVASCSQSTTYYFLTKSTFLSI